MSYIRFMYVLYIISCETGQRSRVPIGVRSKIRDFYRGYVMDHWFLQVADRNSKVSADGNS